MQHTTMNIVLRSATKASDGKVDLVAVPQREAVKRGLIGWLGCWGLAVVTLPIPLVHFVAPPLLILLGPLIGFVVYRLYHGAVDISQGGGLCPDCGTEVVIGPRPEHWPLHLVCTVCESRLILRPSPENVRDISKH